MPKSLRLEFVAALIVTLFLGQLVPSTNAQTSGSDLVTLQAYIVTNGVRDQGILNKDATLVFIVKNQGDQTFQTNTGWQFVWGLDGGVDASHCPYTDTPASGQTSCTRPFTATTNGTYTTIQPGSTVEIDFDWTPGLAQVGLHKLYTNITSLASGTGGVVPPSKGPDTKTDNNDAQFFLFIKQLGPYARADRDKAPNADDVNGAWAQTDIKDPCPTGANAIAREGCKALPGAIVNWNYIVRNNGNALDSFYGQVLDKSGQDNLTHRGYAYNFVPQNFTLDVNQTQNVVLQVIVPLSEWANNGTNVGAPEVKVQWSSLLDPSSTSQKPPNCDNALCTNPSFPSMLIDVKHGLNATENDTYDLRIDQSTYVDTRIANVTQPVTWNVTLNNTGNADDNYTWTIDNDTAQVNGSWQSDIPAYTVISRLTGKNVQFSLVPPANATAGIHRFNISFQSKDDTDGKTHQTLHFAANLQQNYSIAGAMDTGLIRVLPDQKAAYVLRLTNNGNGQDDITLTLENVPYQWQAALSTTVAHVPAFTTMPVYLNVTPPPGTPENTQATFFVNATSLGPTIYTESGPIPLPPDQRSKATMRADLVVLRGPNVRVSPSVRSAFIDPGATADYVLTIQNTGNLRDKFTVNVNRTADQLAWAASGTPSDITLDAGASATATVALQAPSSGSVGETTQVFVTVAATFDPSIRNQTTLQGQVSGPDLFVDSILANTTTPYSGDPVQLSVVLGNGGNKAPDTNVTLKVYFVQDGVPRPIGETTYTAADLPGGRRLTASIDWDTTNVEGSGVLLARIDEANAVAEIDESNNEATRALTIRTFDISVVPAQPLSGLPGEKVSYSEQPHVFLVTYNGNQQSEPVDITVKSEHGWGGSRQTIALPKGTPIPVLVDVQIPTSPGVPTDTLQLTIKPTLRPQALVTSSVTTTVVDNDPPVIASVGASPANVKLGEPTTLLANVTDATGLRAVRAFVVRPDNVTDTYLLESQGGALWTHTQGFTIAGQYRFYVEAVDNSDAQNKNDSRDTVATFNVTPGSAPVITLAGDQQTTIRTGGFIRFNITDPLGIKDASYSVKGISYDLGKFPYEIDTSSFQAGPIDINVTAHNVYDVATTTRFSFLVDNTPPGIHKVTLDPSKPKANQDVTLHIETDAKVSNVQVTIKKDGQLLDTRQAVKRSSGVFELLLNPGEGSYTIDVTAKDAAGNTKLQESAVSFTAKPASPFSVPGPSVGALALAAAAVAIALRRRR